MAINVQTIVSPSEVRDMSANSSLIWLSDNEITAIVKKVCWKIWSKVDVEQFFDKDTKTYTFPDDLKIATIDLIDNYYSLQESSDSTVKTTTLRRERIDDYEIEESFTSSTAYTFFWIPVNADTLNIILKYWDDESWWVWNIDLH